MSHHVFGKLCLIITATVLVCSSTSAADSRTADPSTATFDEIIARIRAADESKQWRKPGWNDDLIEKPLQKVIAEVVRVTDKDFLKLPVTFKEVSGNRDERVAFANGGGLLRAARGNVEFSHAQKSIFLVDGNVRIGHAQDCIVVARGVVQISHGNRNLIIAGQHVDLSHDGNDALRDGARPAQANEPPMKHGSVVLSGGTVQIGHAQGTVCFAPDFADISFASQVSFLRSKQRRVSHEFDCSDNTDVKLPLVFAKTQTFPEDVLLVRQVVDADDPAKQLVVVERDQFEFVLRPGANLTDEKRQPIPDWQAWKLDFISENFALFTDGKQDISYFLKHKP